MAVAGVKAPAARVTPTSATPEIAAIAVTGVELPVTRADVIASTEPVYAPVPVATTFRKPPLSAPRTVCVFDIAPLIGFQVSPAQLERNH